MTVYNHSKPVDSKKQVRSFLQAYQNQLLSRLQQLDAKASFNEDRWQRSHLGHGRTCVIKDGDFFEQGGVNFSEIQGDKLPSTLCGRHPDLAEQSFWGCGVSLVLHPLNPYCPTVHLNYRYFEAGPLWWFAGGADLTPYYPFIEDCTLWHKEHKAAMDKHHPDYYPAFKYWCDEYFYNHHRYETRGIGGTFFDYQDGIEGHIIKSDFSRKSEQSQLNQPQAYLPQRSWDEMFSFQKDNAGAFLKAYMPIAKKRKHMSWSEGERDFQLYRRGRYVEFNLLHDRGTLFGIESKGRVESILISLPPLVRWQYNFEPEPGSRESLLTEKFLHRGIDWLELTTSNV